MLTPELVENLEQHRARKVPEGFRTHERLLRFVERVHFLDEGFQKILVRRRFRLIEHLAEGHRDVEVVLELRREAVEVPLLLHGFRRHVAAEEVREVAFAQVLEEVRAVGGFENLVAEPVDFVTLVVLDVVEFKELLADVVVAAFDLALGRLDHAGEHLRFDRDAFFQAQLVGDRTHALAPEDAQQLVFHREVEAGAPRVALTAGTAAELVVDASGFVTFRPDDAKAPGRHDFVVELLPLGLDGFDLRGAFFFRERLVVADGVHGLVDAAAQDDVGAAARHVGRDRHHAGTARFEDDLRFALVLLGVQDVVFDPGGGEELREHFGILDRRGPEKNRLVLLVAALHVLDDRRVLFLHRTVDLVLFVDADHRAVGRDHDGLQTVDVLELVRFRIRRTGHARELLVHAEVVLEGDRGHRLVFLLDFDAFLGFDGLMEAFRPAAAGHETPGEFVDDDDFAVLHHVVLVALEERVRLQARHEVVHEDDVLGGIERFAFGDETALGQNGLELLVARFRDVDLVGLFVHPVVALALLLSLTGEERRDLVDRDVEVRVVVRRPRDDQRRARFVDQDRVHFVDDRVVEAALTALAHVVFHVVAQVVEPELVVRAVRDVGRIGRTLCFVVLLREDLADREPQPVVEAPHPVRVARSEVVVHRDDVAALAGKGVQVHGQGGGQRLPFAGAHFRDLAVVQDHAADQLHVVVAHAEHAHRRLTHDGEGFGEQIVRRLALGDALAELLRLRLKRFVRERLHGGLELVDRLALAAILLDQAVVATAEDFGQDFIKHADLLHGGARRRRVRAVRA